MTEDVKGRAKGGVARAAALTAERRSEIARNAVAARWHREIPRATHTGILIIGDAEIPATCWKMASAFSRRAEL